MKHILVYLGNVEDLLYPPTLIPLSYKPDNLRNKGRVLVWFNGTQTHLLREIVLSISKGLIMALVPLTVIDKPSSFNAILSCT